MKRHTKLLWQLFPAYLILVLAALVAVGWYTSSAMRSFFMSQTRHDLRIRGELLLFQVAELLPGPVERIDRLCKTQGLISATRITVILPDGTVVGDSEKPPASMENHATRPEIETALAGRMGSSVRYSSTVHHEMMYVALPLKRNGQVAGVVRTSMPMIAIAGALDRLQTRIAVGSLLVVLAAALVCLVISRRISRPLEAMRAGAARFANGDLQHRLAAPAAVELSSLADAMNRMAEQLEGRIQAIEQQRRESEAVLSSMSEGVVAVDLQERIIRANAAAGRIFGRDTDQVLDRTLYEVMRSRELNDMIGIPLTDGRPSGGDIISYHRGEQILNVRCTALQDADGSRMGALMVINDVTQLRRLENMRKDFAASVSHEIKTPLTAIKGFVETLAHGTVDDPEETRRFLGIIVKHVDRLNAIVNDLTKLSRIEQDYEQQQIRREAAKVIDVLDAAIQLCRSGADAKQIHISLDCPTGLTARMDSSMVEQAVVNLLENAVKYSSENSTISVKAMESGQAVHISCTDNGPGIAAKHLPRLFERFYRVDKARSRQMGGTGLGLAIVKHIVLAHGGQVNVDSAPGQGSTFTLTLPK